MGSGISSRRGAGPLRGTSALLLRAVTAAGLLAILHTRGVEGAADDLVTHTGKVLHTTATHEHDGVLLEVVALTGDVGGDLHAAGQPHAGHLAQRRVRLLGGGRVHAGAHTPALRGTLEGGGLALGGLVLPALADQLLNRGHEEPLENLSVGRRAVGMPPRADGSCYGGQPARGNPVAVKVIVEATREAPTP